MQIHNQSVPGSSQPNPGDLRTDITRSNRKGVEQTVDRLLRAREARDAQASAHARAEAARVEHEAAERLERARNVAKERIEADRVELSQRARLLTGERLANIAADDSDPRRQERLVQLRERIGYGNYESPEVYEKTAEKLLGE